MTAHIFILISGLLAGGVSSVALTIWTLRRQRKLAEDEAAELIDSAKKDSEAQFEELKMQLEEDADLALDQLARDTRKLVRRNEEFAEELDDKEEQLKKAFSTQEQTLGRLQQNHKVREQRFETHQARITKLGERVTTLNRKLTDEAEKRSTMTAADVRKQLEDRYAEEITKTATFRAQEIEQDAQLNSERDARTIIMHALNRFARPYCSERGIGLVNFESEAHKLRTYGENDQWIKKIEQLCGVDIVYNESYMSANVMGFDPVRRELGRLVLEAAAREKKLDASIIEKIHDRAKRDLFKRILVDGNRVANELKLKNMHEDIRNMLGALRYRYSFAQNQYFHVAEVGWLCGLLSEELGLSVADGRRAGVLHDIGKAMDHSRDGGHAVIGAEFIEPLGEKPEIVHAVRAHHYDETPSTDLAFLTIAADAISGARPGARRSTMDSYTQKMADLEKIGNSFDGVLATYILSAGREIRVLVDGIRVDDHHALELSKQIAQKIEDELSYPGLIKVTVVRETQAVEFAR